MSRQPDDCSWEEEYMFNQDKEIESLKKLLERAVCAISEAGYEDYDLALMGDIDKAIEVKEIKE